MSDLEHMGRQYLWRINKRGQRVHTQNPTTGRAYCQVENCGGRPLDGKGAEAPTGRRLCQNCTDLAGRNKADYREPSLAVLLGERIAETEPELFVAAQVPGRWGGAPERPVNRLKGRKPKRSSVKHPRPFDDGLPW